MDIRDRWSEISRLYHAALEQPEARRPDFVAEACAADTGLRREVESLLGFHADAATFLDAPAAMERGPTLVGRQLGPYRVEAPLGAGGMGEVYRATDLRLGRAVALKILPQHRRQDARWRERLQREAQAVASLRHPHICVLHDVGEEEDTVFLVMEHLDGETLAARLARGPLDADDACAHGREILDALMETHRHGIVHGDLKPANLMIASSGMKLLDFGLARAASQPLSPFLAGTVPYMAPEQIAGAAVDGRTDIFAFGAILFEMVTGGPLFAGIDRDETPHAARAGDFAAIIERCVAASPNARYQNVGDVARALERLSAPVRSSARLAMFSTAMVLVVSVAAVWRLAGGEAQPAPAPRPLVRQQPADLLRTTNRRVLADAEGVPALSSDGALAAYITGSGDRRAVVLHDLATNATVRVAGVAEVLPVQPRWAPHDDRIAFATRDGVYEAAVHGGPPRRLHQVGDDTRITALAWSRDGRRLAIAAGAAMYTVDLETGARAGRQLLGDGVLTSCDWSPVADRIACAAVDTLIHGMNDRGGMRGTRPTAIAIFSGAAGRVYGGTANFLSPAWAPDSGRLYFVSDQAGFGDVYYVDIGADTLTGDLANDSVRVTSGLNALAISLSADGRRIAHSIAEVHANIWSLPLAYGGPADLTRAEPFTTGRQRIEAIRVSWDRKWVLYDSDINGNFDIFRAPVGGGPAEQLTDALADDFAPDLSPDGRFLAYHSWRTASRDVYVQPIEGGLPRAVTSSAQQEGYPRWSPAGAALAFFDLATERGITAGAYLTRGGPDDWRTPIRVRRGTERVEWSHDGRYLVYPRNGTIEVLSVLSGRSVAVYTPDRRVGDPLAESVALSDDGGTIYFKTHDATDGHAEIWSVPFSGGPAAVVVRFGRRSDRADFAVGAGHFYFTLEEDDKSASVADVLALPAPREADR